MVTDLPQDNGRILQADDRPLLKKASWPELQLKEWLSQLIRVNHPRSGQVILM
jgi:hypothetical protein